MRTPPGAYVYEHWRPDIASCFYVGKGRGKRAWLRRERNRMHSAVVQKLERLGFAVEIRIIASGLTDAAALAMEVDRIAMWRSAGVKLANITEGGDAPSITPESRLLMSAAAIKRTTNSFSGKTHSPETKARWSAGQAARHARARHATS